MSTTAGLREQFRELMRPGETTLSGQALVRLSTRALSVVLIVTNLIGAGAVLAILIFNVVPEPRLADPGRVHLVNALWAAVYVAVAIPAGWLIGTRLFRRSRDWLLAERQPTSEEIRGLLLSPLRLLVVQLVLWLLAAVGFSVLNAGYSGKLAVRIAIVVSLTGVVTAACAYLAAERLLRSAAARALRYGAPERVAVPGVVTRTLMAWALGTALPVLGLAAIGILALTGDRTITAHNLGVALVALTATSLTVGLVAVLLAARTTAEPIRSVRRALSKVQGGDFEIRVPVYDGSEVGQLQLGFNEMVSGLAERERIREAFGAYVDPDVVARIIEQGTNLSGEQVDVTCMFVDIRDFTPFAERNSAPQVVAALNSLFDLVVPIIHGSGGRIDKFVGDGLLAVFGAPRHFSDHADRGVQAALEISRVVSAAGLGFSIGVGVNSGPVVAGNIGGAGRLEFSVIGDAVNVAARVEAATRQTGDVVLISDATVQRLTGEHPPLTERTGVTLKGKRSPVRVYAPAAPGHG